MIVDLIIDGKTYKDVEITNIKYESDLIGKVNTILQKEINSLATHDTCEECKESSCERQ